MADLRIGAAILKEALDRELEKEERLQRNREEQKAAEAVVAQNVRSTPSPEICALRCGRRHGSVV